MAGTDGNEEMNTLKTLVTSLAQSVQTLTARQAAPSELLQLNKSVVLTGELEYQVGLDGRLGSFGLGARLGFCSSVSCTLCDQVWPSRYLEWICCLVLL